MLQSDGAGLVEARLDVLLAVWNCLILFNVTLADNREKDECGLDTGKKGARCLFYGISDLSSGWLTFRRIMSISEYFIPFTRIGINLKKRESHDYTDKTQYFLQPLSVTSLP